MNILFFSDRFSTHTTTFIRNPFNLISKSHNTLYLCRDRGNVVFGKLVVQLSYLKLWFYFQKKIEVRSSKFSRFDPFLYFEINKKITQFKPNLIHCHFGNEAFGIIDNLSKKNSSIPILIQFHGYDASNFLNIKGYVEKLKEIATRKNIYFVFCCDFLRKNLANHGIINFNSNVIYCGIDINLFSREKKSIENDTYTFIQISSFEERKGHLYTIKAFKKLLDKTRNKNLKLILVGSAGGWLEKSKQLVEEFDLEDYVEFPGWVSSEEAKVLLEKSNCFVQHSITNNNNTEGIPNSLMEAMAMEMPIISTYHAGIPELVQDGVNGYLVKERDVDDYVLKMELAINNPVLYPQNRTVILEKFGLSTHVQQIEKIYQLAISKQI